MGKCAPILALAASLLLPGCATDEAAPHSEPGGLIQAGGLDGSSDAAASEVRDDAVPAPEPSGLEHVERVSGGADPDSPLPLVVGLHGLGGGPDAFARDLSRIDVPARIIAPRAPHRFGRGRSWGETAMRGRAPRLERSARQVSALVAEVSTSRPTTGKAVVVGYSQGGVVAFLVAARADERVGAVLPIAGTLPPGLPRDGTAEGRSRPVVRALHGAADPVTAAIHCRRSVIALRRRGADAKVRVYAGAGHGIRGRMLEDLRSILRAMIEASAGAASPALPDDCAPCPGPSVDPESCSLCPG